MSDAAPLLAEMNRRSRTGASGRRRRLRRTTFGILVALITLGIGLATQAQSASADNQITPTNQLPAAGYTADPTARVFGDTLYVYTSTDDKDACRNRPNTGSGGFCMPGYKVSWTTDMVNWQSKDLFKQGDVPWVQANYTMWAPDVQKVGDKYLMLFPANFKIGVAEATSPLGPFIPRANPISGIRGIDPSILRVNNRWVVYSAFRGSGDTNNQIYVWDIDNNFTRASNARRVGGLKAGYQEGPHAYIRNGEIYLMYARTSSGGYRLDVARSSNPASGFRDAGEAVPVFRTGSHGSAPTNHGSIVNYRNRDFVFYHRHVNQQPATPSTRQIWHHRTALFDEICYAGNGNVIPAVHGTNTFRTRGCW